MAGFLTHSMICRLPITLLAPQWLNGLQIIAIEYTAAGTVPGFNGIPLHFFSMAKIQTIIKSNPILVNINTPHRSESIIFAFSVSVELNLIFI